MELSQSSATVLLVLVLVDVGVLVALLLVFGLPWVRRRERKDRPNIPADESESPLLVIGPSEEVVAEPPSAPALVIGPTEPILVRPSSAEALVIGAAREAPVVVAPPRALTVEPPQRAAWDDRGWVKRTENGQEIYEGHYQIADHRSGHIRRFRGVIVVNRGEILPYIADPPAELRRHPKHPCFQLFRPPWFKMHWERAAGNVDDAILYIQRVLDEAINGRRVA
jgi:hypothetical protein